MRVTVLGIIVGDDTYSNCYSRTHRTNKSEVRTSHIAVEVIQHSIKSGFKSVTIESKNKSAIFCKDQIVALIFFFLFFSLLSFCLFLHSTLTLLKMEIETSHKEASTGLEERT